MAKQIPAWVEAIVIRIIKSYVPASAVAEAIQSAKEGLIAWAEGQVANTSNTIDDMVVSKLKSALLACEPGEEFLCDLVLKGQVAFVNMLRVVAARTDTEIDDAVVDVLAEAMGAD